MRIFNEKEQHIGFVKPSLDGFVTSLFPSCKLDYIPGKLVDGGHYRHFAMTEREFKKFKNENRIRVEDDLKQPDIFDFIIQHG